MYFIVRSYFKIRRYQLNFHLADFADFPDLYFYQISVSNIIYTNYNVDTYHIDNKQI